jgi:hypothetical protein
VVIDIVGTVPRWYPGTLSFDPTLGNFTMEVIHVCFTCTLLRAAFLPYALPPPRVPLELSALRGLESKMDQSKVSVSVDEHRQI